MNSLAFRADNHLVDEEFEAGSLPDRNVRAALDELFNEATPEQIATLMTALFNCDEFIKAFMGLCAWDLDRNNSPEYQRSAERVTQLVQEIAQELAEENRI